MEYSENDKFKLTVEGEEARGVVEKVFEDTETYMLEVFDEELPTGYEHFVSEDTIEENWKKDNRIKVEDYF